jgi:carboxypeptidase C (cathepsin A)
MAEQHEADGTGSSAGAVGPTDDLVTTDHVLATPGGELRYAATAGRVVLREEVDEEEKFAGFRAKAEMFVTSYVMEGADPTHRPVTFAFNGGPGSSSVWLHLGLLGPRRVVMGDAGALLPPPWGLADNLETLLARTDLVFIDPVTTGYSRVVEGGKVAEYHDFQRDLESVGSLIRLWTSRNGRWLSPKYLAGESYGTIRASALADHLQKRYGLFANGIMLISSVIDMGTIRFSEGNDQPNALYLPTYAALAHYHGLHGDRPIEDVRAEAEDLAARDYPWALERASRLSASERADIVKRLAAVTGLSEDYVEQVDLRIEHQRFFRELLRSRGQVIGRLDGRFVGYEPDDAGEKPSHDPSNVAIHGPYAAAFNHYVRNELGYESDLPYEILTDRVQPWSYAQFEGRAVSISSMLAEAMRHNPHLRVHVACGYYDAATPYFAAEHAFAHLQVPDHLRANIEMHYYPAGHMTYVHEPSRIRQSADLAAFVAPG